MKIIHINFSFTRGGIDTMMIDIINHQVKTCIIELIILNNNIDFELLGQLNKEVKIYLVKRPEGSRNPFYIIKLNRIISRSKPDYIHCHNNRLHRLLFTGIKKGLTVHALNLQVDSLEKYDQVFAISNTVMEDIKRRSNINPNVIYNGIDFNLIKRSSGEYSDEVFRIIQVSRLDEKLEKGQNILIQALYLLKKKYGKDNIQVNFVGTGPSYNYLYKMVKDMALEGVVKFLGAQSREYVYKNIFRYNLLVQPSINEGFGLTVLEGIGAQIPVLASDTNGPAEIAKILNYNFLFETGNPDKLAEAILTIYNKNNDQLFNKMLHEYSEQARKVFSIEQTSNNYIHIYRK